MKSANGYKLVVEKGSETFELVASWKAPFFSLLDLDEARPLLYHAESLADAIRFGGKILNSDFTEYTALRDAA